MWPLWHGFSFMSNLDLLSFNAKSSPLQLCWNMFEFTVFRSLFLQFCLHYWSTNLLLDCIRSISIDCTWLCFISIDFIQYVCSYLCLVHMFSCSAVVTDAHLGHTTELCKIHMKLADTFTITVRRSSCSLFNPVLSGSPLRRCFLHTFWDAWVNPPTCIIYTYFLPDSSFNISVICVQVSMFVRMLQNSLQTL